MVHHLPEHMEYVETLNLNHLRVPQGSSDGYISIQHLFNPSSLILYHSCHRKPLPTRIEHKTKFPPDVPTLQVKFCDMYKSPSILLEC